MTERTMNSPLGLACIAAMVLGITGGCIRIPTKHGAYHLIIGVGVVAVSELDDEAVVATNANSLGVAISNRPGMKVGLGYASSSVVSVADGAVDVRVEVSRRPFGRLTVDTQKAELEHPAGTGTQGSDLEKGGAE